MNQLTACLLFFLFLFSRIEVLHAQRIDADIVPQQDIWETYAIPRCLQREEMEIFLRRMEWYFKAAQSNNWQIATLHPARTKEHPWDRIELFYEFEAIPLKKDYYLYAFSTSHGVGEFFTRDLIFEGTLILTPAGQPSFFQMLPFGWNVEFSTKDRSGELCFHVPDDPMQKKGEFRENRIAWDKVGQIVFDDYKKHGDDFWREAEKAFCRDYYQRLKATTLSGEPAAEKITIRDSGGVRVPSGGGKELAKRLASIQKKYTMLNDGAVKQLLDCPFTKTTPKWNWHVMFRFEKDRLFDVAITQDTGAEHRTGEYALLDENGLHIWREGGLLDIASDTTNSLPLTCYYAISGSGVEVKFHPTGYPASYKTIVKNRLFGRQIEWNDQGEVISDVNLDIPMPWLDAPSGEAKTSPPQSPPK